MLREKYLELLQAIGFEEIEDLNMDAVVPVDAVREMCSSGKCRKYGTSWSCPPALDSLEVMRKKIAAYDRGLIFQTLSPMSDAFDMESIRRGEALHRKRFDTFARQARMLDSACMPMSAGTCTICRKCTYPDAPCRYPKRVFPSMEACGLLVNEVCRASGMKYYYGSGYISFTSCILF